MVLFLVHYLLKRLGVLLISQADVLERLYYVPNLTINELSVILDLNTSSVERNIARLKKVNYVEKGERGYQLTSKGKDFAKRYYI